MNLYLFKMQGFVKVGVSDNPEARAKQIENSSPFSVSIEKVVLLPKKSIAFELESKVHRKLKELGMHIKLEWFCCDIATAEKVIIDSLKEINKEKKTRKKSKLMMAEEKINAKKAKLDKLKNLSSKLQALLVLEQTNQQALSNKRTNEMLKQAMLSGGSNSLIKLLETRIETMKGKLNG
jgi:hypothetical protein